MALATNVHRYDKESRQEITELLSNLRTDFNLLGDGDWVPDNHSVNSSIDAVERLAKLLSVELTEEE